MFSVACERIYADTFWRGRVSQSLCISEEKEEGERDEEEKKRKALRNCETSGHEATRLRGSGITEVN